MSDEPDAYQTYLLHLWRAKCQGRWQWRASIESPHTGERHAFASLEQVSTFRSERCDSQVPHMPQQPVVKGGTIRHRQALQEGARRSTESIRPGRDHGLEW